MTERRNGVLAQRRTRSRASLIAAAQEFLAAGKTEFTVSDVAARADVALQTLYNHFSSKDALVAAAAAAAIEEWESDLLACTSELRDPLEQLSANMRLFARMPDSHPRLAAIVVNSWSTAIARPRGYTERALQHVQGIAATGAIKPLNLDLALMATVASTERLMELRTRDRSRGPAEVDELVFQNLIVFGVPKQTIARLLAKPLPAIRTEPPTSPSRRLRKR